MAMPLCVRPDSARLAHLRQTKVRHLHHAVVADHDVRRFDVAVDDAALMRVGQRIAHMRGDRHRVLGVQPLLLGEHPGHIRALDELHHDVEQAACGLAKVIDADDAGVAELGHGAGLVLEALGKAGVRLLQPVGEDLDGDGAVQRDLRCPLYTAPMPPRPSSAVISYCGSSF
jgi:hypothetical protein